MRVYYNEWDEPTAAWLRTLGEERHLAAGHVDTRSIRDVRAGDLCGYDQCHFFAGIGGWPLALRLAGYEHLPCWTGSPPCQPFSVAGQRRGANDERHLAPVWLDLVRECCPPILFGEQVADAIRHGWLDDLFDALESYGYACGAAVLPACSVGAPHIRKRLFFGAVRLADAECWASERYGHEVGGASRGMQGPSREQRFWSNSGDDVAISRLANPYTNRRETRREIRPVCSEHDAQYGGTARGLAHTDGAGRRQTGCDAPSNREVDAGWPGDWHSDGSAHDFYSELVGSYGTCPHHSFWSGADWLGCRDGKFRPVEPGTQPLAHGLPARVGRLRGYGNAIVPQVAAAFIKEFLGAAAEIASAN